MTSIHEVRAAPFEKAMAPLDRYRARADRSTAEDAGDADTDVDADDAEDLVDPSDPLPLLLPPFRS